MALPSFGQPIARIDIASLAGSVALSVTGTANQITVSPTVGNVVVSLPTSGTLPGSWHAATGFTLDAGNLTMPAGASILGLGALTITAGGGGIVVNADGSITITPAAGKVIAAAPTAAGNAANLLNLTYNGSGKGLYLKMGSGSAGVPSGTQYNGDGLYIEDYNDNASAIKIDKFSLNNGESLITINDVGTVAGTDTTNVLTVNNFAVGGYAGFEFTNWGRIRTGRSITQADLNLRRKQTVSVTDANAVHVLWVMDGYLGAFDPNNAVNLAIASTYGSKTQGIEFVHAWNGTTDNPVSTQRQLFSSSIQGSAANPLETTPRWNMTILGQQSWGPGGASPVDTQMGRSPSGGVFISTDAVAGMTVPTQGGTTANGTSGTGPGILLALYPGSYTVIPGVEQKNFFIQAATFNFTSQVVTQRFAYFQQPILTATSAITNTTTTMLAIDTPTVSGANYRATQLNVATLGSTATAGNPGAAFNYNVVNVPAHTLTITSGTASLTATPTVAGLKLGIITVNKTAAAVTLDFAATLYIAGAPLAGSAGITTPLALWVDAGVSRFDGLVQTVLSATGGAGLNLPHGAAPTSPVDGDMWTTTAGLFVRINGVTKEVVFV